MKLNVKERYALRGIFIPKTASLLESDLLDELIDKVKITSSEMKKLDMKIDSNFATWDIKKDEGIEVDIPDALLSLLQKSVKEADKEGRIPYDPDDRTVRDLAKKILNYKV